MTVSFPWENCRRASSGILFGGQGFPAGGEQAGTDGGPGEPIFPNTSSTGAPSPSNRQGVLFGQTRGQAGRLEDRWPGFPQPAFERRVRTVHRLRQGEAVGEADTQPSEFHLQEGTVTRRGFVETNDLPSMTTRRVEEIPFLRALPLPPGKAHQQRCRHDASGGNPTVHRSAP